MIIIGFYESNQDKLENREDITNKIKNLLEKEGYTLTEEGFVSTMFESLDEKNARLERQNKEYKNVTDVMDVYTITLEEN